uniref:MADF domain-containing protein n=2 Tax=Caenorhabditis japonica TaxID=281687 RepID=A0A8R1DLA8_CAEJA
MPTIRSNLSIPLAAIEKLDDGKMETDEKVEKRAETAFRPLSVKCGVFGAQDGSGYAEFGNTRVLAQIYGTVENRTARNGTVKNRNARNRTAKSRTTRIGIAKNRTARNGTVKNRTTRNETAKNRTARNGTVKNRTVRNGTARNGTAKNRTARNRMSSSDAEQNYEVAGEEVYPYTAEVYPYTAPKNTGGRKSKLKKEDGYDSYKFEDMVELIQLVELQPALWDPADPNYHRDEFCFKMWDRIELQCKNFMPRGKKNGTVAKTRFNEIKGKYSDFVKRVQRAPSGSGAENACFPFARYLKFLDTASEKRSVQNAFIFGTPGITRRETSDEVLEAPKKRRKGSAEQNDITDRILMMMERNEKRMERFENQQIAEGTTEGYRIGMVFDDHTRGWGQMDKIKSESAVVTFIQKLRPASSSGRFPPLNTSLFSPPPSSPDYSVPSTSHNYDFY